MQSDKIKQESAYARWWVLALLTTGVLISFVDRTSISYALADHAFIQEFSLKSVDRGWISAAFFWSYGIMQVPMGWAADRFGVKWPYAVCFALWCIATAAMGLVETMQSLIVMRLIVGVAEAFVIPGSYRWIRNHFDERHNGLAVGILAMGNKLGPALGAPVGAWLIFHYSWKAMFVATGLVGLVWLVPWLLVVRNDLPSKTKLAEVSRDARSVKLVNVIRSPVVWGGMITNFCYGYFTFYCMTWMPAYLVERRGLTLTKSGWISLFSFGGIAVVAAVAGWAADRIIARGGDPIRVRKYFIVAGFVGGGTILLGGYAHSVTAALFWNVFSLSCLGLNTANNLVLSRLTLIPKQAIGLVTGVQQLATSLAGGVAASLSGWLLQVSGGYHLPMWVILGFMVVGAAATMILYRREWAPKVVGEGIGMPDPLQHVTSIPRR